jgi:serine/threonine protein kinase
VSLGDFSFVKNLGEGGFGKVVLATGSLPGRTEQLYAIKAVNKRRMTSRDICCIFAEKEALMSTLTLSCFLSSGGTQGPNNVS